MPILNFLRELFGGDEVITIRVLHECRIALPRDNPISPGDEEITLRKEDVLTLPVKYARGLIKRGYAEEIVTNPYGIRKVEANTHDMAKSGAEGMADVEG